MIQDEIIRMAREAGFTDMSYFMLENELERFAALVAANEREKQAEQEPVYIENIYKSGDKYFAWIGDDYVQIYTAPVRTKDLTDDEILAIAIQYDAEGGISDVEYGRRVIAAYKEKNK